MKLFVRMINEGFFAFWKPTNNCLATRFTISMVMNSEEIEIAKYDIPNNLHCYSMNRLPLGEYVLKIESVHNDEVVESDVKNVKIESFAIKQNESFENIEKLANEMQSIKDKIEDALYKLSNIDGSVDSLVSMVDRM